MHRTAFRSLLAIFILMLGAVARRAADEPSYSRTEDVIYGRKYGTALTMDVFTPKKNANGAAVIFAVSGGWNSSHDAIKPVFVAEYLRRGYTVFAVVHGSQPKFTIPEMLTDMHRAVRFIRYHAKDYQIDPERLGITGASAGGHLSLMQGTAGELGDPKAKDPIDRVSSRVQAVACFFPPTDFLNYGVKDHMLTSAIVQPPFRAALDFHELDRDKRMYVPITEDKKVRDILRQISPITHVSADDPPTLIVHGDADTLVPLQQSEIIVAKFKEVGVPVELVVKPGAGHGWATILNDVPTLADWFDKHLRKTERPATDK